MNSASDSRLTRRAVWLSMSSRADSAATVFRQADMSAPMTKALGPLGKDDSLGAGSADANGHPPAWLGTCWQDLRTRS